MKQGVDAGSQGSPGKRWVVNVLSSDELGRQCVLQQVGWTVVGHWVVCPGKDAAGLKTWKRTGKTLHSVLVV